MEIHPTEMSQGEKDCKECLTSTISAKLHEGAQKAESLISSACIYRVPEELRKLNASAYTPRLIAIGPLHRDDKHLQTPMQQVKMSYANHLLCRLTEGVEDRELARFSLLQECVAEMKLSIDDAKKCYAEEVTLDVEMMLVDGCFILELLYRNFEFYWFFCNIESSHPIVGSDNGYSEEETMTASNELQPLPVAESRIEVERSRTIEEILMRPEGNSTDDHVLRDFGNEMENSEPEEGEVVPSRPAANHYHHILHKVHDGYLPPDHTGKTKLNKIVGSDNGYSEEETMTASTELQPLPVAESRIEVERSRTIEEILGLQTADPILGNRLTSYAVRIDLLLLENQIPYLVLEKLFPLTVGRIPSGLNRLSLTGYLVLYFGKKMRPEGNSTDEDSEPEEEVPSRPAYHHILHKVHDGYLPPDQTGKINEHYEIMPSATELVYAGVKFVRGTEEDDLFKVKFNKPEGPFWWGRSARFEIPTLKMDDSMEPFIRNLIAFEQCCPGVPQPFTSYAMLMDMLVDSDKDVQVLEKARVVRNLLGASEDATKLFNNLCKEIVLREFFFADICNRAHKYRRSFWPKNIAHVRRQYFASPWRFIAFCLAFCAVGISITQFLRSFSWP